MEIVNTLLKEYAGALLLIPYLATIGVMFRLFRTQRESDQARHAAEIERVRAEAATVLLGSRGDAVRLEIEKQGLTNQILLLERMADAEKSAQPQLVDSTNTLRLDPASKPDATREIELSCAIDFYNAIAAKYDERNTAPYFRVQQALFDSVAPRVGERTIRVLDVGGGTGSLFLKFRHKNIKRWTNLDFSSESLKVFRETFPSDECLSSRCLDFETPSAVEKTDQFDLIFLSFIWSSMPRDPSLGTLLSAMTPSSLLVVADNHFDYTCRNPIYGVTETGSGAVHIRPRPLSSDRIREHAESCGFTQISFVETNGTGEAPYAQIHVFKAKYETPF